MSSNRVMTTIRLPPDLLAWGRVHSKAHNVSFTSLVEDLLTALREGRLAVRPRAGPSPFPREDIEAGSTPEYPILVAPGLRQTPPAGHPDMAEGKQFVGKVNS